MTTLKKTIKPIETVYDGHRFRSRLEARWAVVWKELGIPYVYEPEGYDLGKDGWYLPDFLLYGKCFIEIKPSDPTCADLTKAESLANLGLHPVIALCGQPKIGNYKAFYYNMVPACEITGDACGICIEDDCKDYILDSEVGVIGSCRRCDALAFVAENYAVVIGDCDKKCTAAEAGRWPIPDELDSKIERAFKTATMERFEQ